MDITEHIISLERLALDRWIQCDPDGYLSIYAAYATYFDPYLEMRIGGTEELTKQLSLIRDIELPFTEVRYEILNPTVELESSIAVLSFNLVNYGKPSGRSKEIIIARWNATEVYRKIDGEWLIIHTHWSFTKPQFAASDVPTI